MTWPWQCERVEECEITTNAHCRGKAEEIMRQSRWLIKLTRGIQSSTPSFFWIFSHLQPFGGPSALFWNLYVKLSAGTCCAGSCAEPSAGTFYPFAGAFCWHWFAEKLLETSSGIVSFSSRSLCIGAFNRCWPTALVPAKVEGSSGGSQRKGVSRRVRAQADFAFPINAKVTSASWKTQRVKLFGNTLV